MTQTDSIHENDTNNPENCTEKARMTSTETRDKLAEEFVARLNGDKKTRLAFLEAWDACRLHDPDVKALVEALERFCNDEGYAVSDKSGHYLARALFQFKEGK